MGARIAPPRARQLRYPPHKRFPKGAGLAYYASSRSPMFPPRSEDQRSPSSDADPGGATYAETAATSRRSQLIFIYGMGLAIGLQSSLMNYAISHKLKSAAFVLFASLVYAALVMVLWQSVLPRFSRLSLGWRIAAQTALSTLAVHRPVDRADGSARAAARRVVAAVAIRRSRSDHHHPGSDHPPCAGGVLAHSDPAGGADLRRRLPSALVAHRAPAGPSGGAARAGGVGAARGAARAGESALPLQQS